MKTICRHSPRWSLLVVALCVASKLDAADQLPSPPVVEADAGQAIEPLPETGPPPTSVDLPQSLILSDFPKGIWKHYTAKKDTPLTETWSVAIDPDSGQPMIVCKGSPNGYIRTLKEYRNFDLSLEWRFPSEQNGNNSGILLFTADEEKIWPASIQVQLYQPELGRAFATGSAKAENEIRDVPPVANPVGKWNRCEISCRDGIVQVCVNGRELGKITGCNPASGAICLQSEGSEIHFRNVRLRELPTSPLADALPPPPETVVTSPAVPALVQVKDDPPAPAAN